ncbi:hypothetical protein KY358_03790 [Candidatus Woesearchaeota archaeon]|nr:hypothetical protein [Candidatus Woesearchaeota archaeon]
MYNKCFGSGLISAIATWGFFALLLTLLKVENAQVNAVWLTLLAVAAVFFCPVMNKDILKCCGKKAGEGKNGKKGK